ncbi:hypothetical protein [Luteitalea pratensis]|nr:hypothetical protein [Luteitalea pratensis]
MSSMVLDVARRIRVCILMSAVSTCLVVVPSRVSAQDTPVSAPDTKAPARANAVYFELLGNGGLFSVNYERALTPALRVRIGAASWTAEDLFGGTATHISTFPMMLHVVPGDGAHHVEAGLGVLPGQRGPDRSAGGSGAFVSLIGVVGYRYEPRGSRFLFRAGVTPFYGFGDASIAYPDEGFMPSVGVSFGARF